MAGAGLTAQAVADLVGGRLLGKGDLVISSVRPLEDAGPASLSLATGPRYAGALASSTAGAVLVTEGLASAPSASSARIVVGDPYRAIVQVMRSLFPPTEVPSGIHPNAILGRRLRLGERVTIGPFAVLGDDVSLGAECRIASSAVLGDGVVVGPGSEIGPGAVCYAGSRIGARVVLKAHAVIGGDGFGYLPAADGHQRIPHVGGCVIGDGVEIGSCSCVDRGSLDDTVIGRGSKIDNLVHVAHNVRMGERCLVMAGVGIAGSTRIGDDVILAGHVGVTDHLQIGNGARVAAKSAVFGDVPAGASVSGHPARSHRQFLRAQAASYRVAPIIDRLERLAAESTRDA